MIRPMVADDLPSVENLFFSEHIVFPTEEGFCHVQRCLSNRPMVWEENGIVVAFSSLGYPAGDNEIWSGTTIVHRHYKGKGIGKRMIQDKLSSLDKGTKVRVHSWVHPQDKGATSDLVYKGLGFSEVQSMEGYYESECESDGYSCPYRLNNQCTCIKKILTKTM